MRRGNIILAVIALILALQFTACNKADTIGGDIVNTDHLNVKHTTSDFKFFVEKVDSVITYKNLASTLGSHFICGELREDVFGLSSSEIYTQLRVNFRSDFDLSNNFQVDSATLILYYDKSSFYGDTMTEVGLDVFEMTEPLDTSNTYYSHQSFMSMMQIGGTKTNIIPNLTDSFEIITNLPDNEIDTTVVKGAIKLPIDNQMFLDKLLFDSLLFQKPDSIINLIHGIKISARTDEKRLIGLNIPASFLRVHYSNPDTNYIISYFFNTTFFDKLVSTVNYKQEYQNSVIQDFFTADEDTLGFVRGMSGVQTKVVLSPNSTLTGNVAISHAEMTLNVKALPGDNLDYYNPISILLTATKDQDGVLFLTSDAEKAWDAFNNNGGNVDRLRSDFGGVVSKKEDGSWQYKLNITSYYQDFLNGIETGTFYISLPAGQESPARVVFCGPDNVQEPAKLKVTYTEF